MDTPKRITSQGYPEDVKVRALELYQETKSSYKAAEAVGVNALTVRTWAQAVDGFLSTLNQERRQSHADKWFEVGDRLLDRMLESGVDALRPDQLSVPAGIATDKLVKLTEETNTQQAPGSYVVVMGNAQIVQQATIQRTE